MCVDDISNQAAGLGVTAYICTAMRTHPASAGVQVSFPFSPPTLVVADVLFLVCLSFVDLFAFDRIPLHCDADTPPQLEFRFLSSRLGP